MCFLLSLRLIPQHTLYGPAHGLSCLTEHPTIHPGGRYGYRHLNRRDKVSTQITSTKSPMPSFGRLTTHPGTRSGRRVRNRRRRASSRLSAFVLMSYNTSWHWLLSPTSKSPPPSFLRFPTLVWTSYNTPWCPLRSPTSRSTRQSCCRFKPFFSTL
ncbi:hypothetical protein C8F04DRAFT_42410 [Mycena alexandri]|uniref:Uncharacterized protein n=1 Tax=Mycena alexandri TaxID=1745969 RepID=A0AAD6SN73_9AGAR|nr:hypothetical protein C8F04DRAFT_42410 [Mycena alexandri]